MSRVCYESVFHWYVIFKCGKVKHEFWVMSWNPRVTSSHPRVTSSNLRVTSSNLRVTSLKPRFGRQEHKLWD